MPPTSSVPAGEPATPSRRTVFVIATVLWVVVVVVTVLPLIGEIAASISGQHLWTIESLVFIVLPIATGVGGWLLIRAGRAAGRLFVTIVLSALGVAIPVAGSAPLVTLYSVLLAAQFSTPAP